MRTIIEETTVYLFEELPEEAQQKALENLWDINVDFDWWQFIYEDAECIGLKITEFDLDRNRYVKGDFLWSALECAHKIINEHGRQCDTWNTANDYLISRDKLVEKYADPKQPDKVHEDSEYEFDLECDDLDREFLHSLLEDYSIILQKEYEWLTNEEQIKETLIANEYEFTIDAKIY